MEVQLGRRLTELIALRRQSDPVVAVRCLLELHLQHAALTRPAPRVQLAEYAPGRGVRIGERKPEVGEGLLGPQALP
jgi:hypothetical protein